MSPPRPPIISWSLDNPPFACTLSAGEKEDDDAFFPNEVDCDFNADRLRRMEFAVSVVVVVVADAFKLCEIILVLLLSYSFARISFKTQTVCVL